MRNVSLMIVNSKRSVEELTLLFRRKEYYMEVVWCTPVDGFFPSLKSG